MSDVRQREAAAGVGRGRGGGRSVLLITISRQTHERPEGPASRTVMRNR